MFRPLTPGMSPGIGKRFWAGVRRKNGASRTTHNFSPGAQDSSRCGGPPSPLPHQCGQLLEDIMGTTSRHLVFTGLFTLAVSVAAFAQPVPPPPETADLSGPRFGLSLLADGVVDKLAERDIHVGS